jgi:hypothetical protein
LYTCYNLSDSTGGNSLFLQRADEEIDCFYGGNKNAKCGFSSRLWLLGSEGWVAAIGELRADRFLKPKAQSLSARA